MADETDDIEVATVTIRKLLTSDDYEINYSAVDEQGDKLALIDTLGLLEFAKMSIISDWAGS